jgi:hypothetical protein
MLAEQVDYLIGVETHRDQHALAAVDARTGAVVAQATTAANAQGYACTLRLAERHAPGARVWAIEGSGATSPAHLYRVMQNASPAMT